MKLTPGVNFINVLRAAFAHADTRSIKNAVKSSVSFNLLGSAHIKAARRTLMNLTPGVTLHFDFPKNKLFSLKKQDKIQKYCSKFWKNVT